MARRRLQSTVVVVVVTAALAAVGLGLAPEAAAAATRRRLVEALASPSGKLTLSPELVVPEPSDMTALLLQATAVQALSGRVRAAKANAAFLRGAPLALRTLAAEQEAARGAFPGPLPVVYCGAGSGGAAGGILSPEELQEVAEAGACGVLVPLTPDALQGDNGAGHAAAAAAALRAALACGLQPVPEVTLQEHEAAAWGEADVARLVDQLGAILGADPVALVLSVDAAGDEDPEGDGEAKHKAPVTIPPVSKELRSRTAILGSVRVSGGEGRLGAETARFKEAGYSGALLRSDCVPGFRMNLDLEFVGRFWAACIDDLKSTRSKSFSFRSKNNMDKSLGTQWANLQNSVIESGALGDPNEQVSIMDSSNGDYRGF